MLNSATVSNDFYDGLQDVVNSVPEFVQPLMVAALGMIPYVEGEGSAALGILAGIHPITAAVAAAVGNLSIVVVVVLLSSRVRESVVARRAPGPRSPLGSVGTGTTGSGDLLERTTSKPGRVAKGRSRLAVWVTRFGVPGASILAPVALPTHLTAAFLVASGVKKSWVILWQAVAIVLWTGAVAVVALGVANAFDLR
ncbi:small multidrug efflux protein [Kineococcus sp. T13]|uniref:small multidrug efflux protein n=1 Tax=Kineococcus vitellinus TaxID=2696565 RepID=UPI001412A92C|nr:small multidrug efflux protein [Kineococcus vitellinus]NAZ73975.1 small multidrug efflux protein [Kineococcus vitellinus]